ncbi:MAG: hypothetical protein JNK23_09490 [Opitutaceae bacterium]|nr:hypothetical protein [Opitutaceae bacterium]
MRAIFLPLLLALALCPSAARATLAHPQLTALTRESPVTVTPGGKVEFRYAISPGTAPTRSLIVQLVNPGGIRGVQLLTVENPGSGLASATVDSTWLNGRYEIESVRVVDQWSRTVTYRADGSVSAQPRDGDYYAEARSHSLDLYGLAFVVTSATAQQRRPELTSVTLRSANMAAPGDTVRVGYTVTAGQSPLTRVAMTFRHTTANTTVTLAPALDTTALSGEITLPIAAAVMNGRYRLNTVTLTDAAGRRTSYGAFGALSEFFDGSSYPTADASNVLVNAIEFAVEGASAATTLPRVVSLSRDAIGTANVGETLRFAYDTAVVGYPVEQVVGILSGPYGGTQLFTSHAASGVFTVQVTPSWISGLHSFRISSIVDSAGRSAATTGLVTSVSFDVRALSIPVYFTQQPESETRVVAGRSVTLFAQGVGLETVSYRWFRGEPGDTRSPLTSDQGFPHQLTFFAQESATCWVRLTSGTATADSRAARVVIVPPEPAPTITEHPVGQVVPVGGTATFAVTASGNGPFTYRWFGGGDRSGQVRNQRTFRLPVLGTEDAGPITCMVSNGGGETQSRPATLTVLAADSPLAITEEPSDIVTVPGVISVRLQATVRGNPPISVTWQKIGADSPALPALTTSSVERTVTSVTLRNPTATAAGRYRMVATNGFETVFSREAELRFSNLPIIFLQPVPILNPIFGDSFRVSVGVFGTEPFSFQWRKDGVAIPGATNRELQVFNLTDAASGSYDVVVGNATGSVTSSLSVVTVRRLPPPLVIVRRPTTRTASPGEDITFTAEASGENVVYTWASGGRVLQTGVAPTFVLRSVGASDSGSYLVEMRDATGRSETVNFALTVTATRDAPVITRQPSSASVMRGDTGHLSVAVDGRPPFQFQWRYKGVPIRANSGYWDFDWHMLFAPAFSSTRTGAYDVVVSNDFGSVTSVPAILSLPPPSTAGRLMNLSVRARAGAESGPLIVGFVLGGGVAEDVPLLVRAAGPALQAFGVPGVLPNPLATLYAGAAPRFVNDDWSGFAPIAAAAARVGAFPFPLADARDAAFARAVAPGAYSVHVTGADGAAGIALAEIYDDTPAAEITTQRPRLLNLSVQTRVEPGAPVIAGFALGGAEPRRVLVRAVGPSLGAFGVGGTLADPQLALMRGQERIAENNDWAGLASIRTAFELVGAFAFSSPDSKDAALIANLAPGPYTVQITGATGTAGLVLVEVYELP